jgi:hypothetical protein
MMREQHRLRPLQVRISRHDHINVPISRTGDLALQHI